MDINQLCVKNIPRLLKFLWGFFKKDLALAVEVKLHKFTNEDYIRPFEARIDEDGSIVTAMELERDLEKLHGITSKVKGPTLTTTSSRDDITFTLEIKAVVKKVDFECRVEDVCFYYSPNKKLCFWKKNKKYLPSSLYPNPNSLKKVINYTDPLSIHFKVDKWFVKNFLNKNLIKIGLVDVSNKIFYTEKKDIKALKKSIVKNNEKGLLR